MAVTALAALAVASGCGAADVVTGDEPLERLHGPIDPAVLTQPLERPTPPPVTAPDGSRWRISNVLDGQTLELFRGLERVTATLGGIRAPTGDECLAQLATDSLTFVTGGGRAVEVTPSTPTGGAIVDAWVVDDNGDDLALVMLTLGLAEVVEVSAVDVEAYRAAEAAARAEGLGIWSAECAEA